MCACMCVCACACEREREREELLENLCSSMIPDEQTAVFTTNKK